MSKLTAWKKERIRQRFQAMSGELIPLIDDLMGRNKDVTSWEQLSEKDLETLQHIDVYYFFDFNWICAIQQGLITQGAEKIKAFIAWDDSLGGNDD
jgi:hypothetical protein